MGSRPIKSIQFLSFGEVNAAWVGRNEVKSIIEHCACGEGDRWHYDIHYENGGMLRIFNVQIVDFGPEEKDEFDIGDLGPPLPREEK